MGVKLKGHEYFHPICGCVMFINGRFCEHIKSKNDYKSWTCGKGAKVGVSMSVWWWGY
jgi:hypothetical protein